MRNTFKTINIDEELWRRYDECYQCAKYNNDAAAMLMATDRMAVLMGVTFDVDYEDDDTDGVNS